MILTTAIVLLAVVASMRSILTGQVAQAANEGIVQEVEEFRTFVAEGVDPTTAEPFASETDLLERYLSRQTPATDEAFIAVSDDRIMFLDNAAADAGELLAQDNAEIERLITSDQTSGVDSTAYGTMRWGRAETEGGSALLVLQFTDPAREQVNQQTLILSAVAAGGLVLTAAIAWFVSGQILLPVRRISELAEAVDDQELSARIPVEGRDDIARAAHAVNGMLDRLENAYGRQRHFVAEAREHLNRPLSKGLRVLKDVPGDEPASARQAMKDMRRTLADLALLADAQTPGFLHPKPTSVPALLVQVVKKAHRQAADRDWNLDEVPEVTAHLDREAVNAALLQLTSNAAEHTAAGDEITLSAVVLDPQESGNFDGAIVPNEDEASVVVGPVLRLAVSNVGEPLAPEAARAMIEEYRSAAQEEVTSSDSETSPESRERVLGMGLGLAVARSVADAHNGSLWVSSDPTGRTTVGLDLPMPQVSRAEEHQEEVAEAMESER